MIGYGTLLMTPESLFHFSIFLSIKRYIYVFFIVFLECSTFHIFLSFFLFLHDTREKRQRQTTTQTGANDKMTFVPWSE